MPMQPRTGRLAVLFVLVIGLMVALTAPAGAATAAARSRVYVKIEMRGQLTGPDSVAGTFTSTVGRIEDSGTYTETFTIVGDVIDGVKVLTGSRGTVAISVHSFIDFPTPTTATFRGGQWRILYGTGAYSGLQGGGRPGAKGGADLAAGTVDVSHRGTARLGPN
jgi:hypothetical protein